MIVYSGSLGNVFQLRTALENQRIRDRYVSFLESGIVFLEENELAKQQEASMNTTTIIYSASTILFKPTRPIKYINVDFHISSEDEKATDKED